MTDATNGPPGEYHEITTDPISDDDELAKAIAARRLAWREWRAERLAFRREIAREIMCNLLKGNCNGAKIEWNDD